MSGSIEQLEEVFARMRAEAGWNTDAPLLWGHFFVDPDPASLERAASQLAAAGFRPVAIFQLEDSPDFMLHVEQVGTHSPTSLHARNAELHALAGEWGLAAYDGWDVGAVPAGA